MNEGRPSSRSTRDHELISRYSDFIGSVEAHLIPLQPTQPTQDTLVEILLEGPPYDDFGDVAIFPTPWSSWHLFMARPLVLVLRHPSDTTRGITLCESCNRQELANAARSMVTNLDRIRRFRPLEKCLHHLSACYLEVSDVPEEFYKALSVDLELQASVIAVCAEHLQADSSATTTNTDAGSAAATSGQMCNDCPICLSEIEPGDAAMRCAGDGGQHHYYHMDCMLQWVEQCHATGLADADCPTCRGRIQVHRQRLEQFLGSDQSEGLAATRRTFLKHLVNRLNARGDFAWGDAFTQKIDFIEQVMQDFRRHERRGRRRGGGRTCRLCASCN